LDWLGLSPEAAFDPCRNLAAAGQVLRAGYRPSPDETPQQSLRVALSRYNTGHPSRGFRNGYVARVEAAAESLGLVQAAREVPNTAPIPQTPPAPVAAWDVFGSARAAVALVFASTESSRGGQR
ncbi:MAG: lytic transglycosylase domain-containing protein, partial [Brevundimonas sp.]